MNNIPTIVPVDFRKQIEIENFIHLWEICKPLFSKKAMITDERIQLIENGELVTDNYQLSEIFMGSFIQ